MGQIQDPRDHKVAYVNDKNRLTVEAVQIDEQLSESIDGNGYNLNTGVINLTSSTASGVMYFKNQELHDVVISAVAVGIGNGGTPDEKAIVTVVRNPTSVSFSTDVDINENRNHSSTKSLADASVAYKGAEGATVTGGADSLLFFQGPGRLFAPIDLVLGPGNSIAIKVDPQVTAGSCNVYAALVIYVHPEINE